MWHATKPGPSATTVRRHRAPQTERAACIVVLLLAANAVAATPSESDSPPPGPPPAALTLAQAQQLCRDNNFDLVIAAERLAAAVALGKQAWAPLLPALFADASVLRHNVEVTIPFGLPGSLRPVFASIGEPFPEPTDITIQKLVQTDASITAQWLLLDAAHWPRLKAARATVEQTRVNVELIRRALAYATAVAFYDALGAEKLVGIRQRAIATAQANARLAQARVELGAATRMEALRAETEVADAEHRQVQADNGAALARRALATLIGWIDERGNMPDFTLTEPPPRDSLPMGDTLQLAFDHRLDLAASKIGLQIAETTRQLTWTTYLPSVVALGSYRWSSVEGFSGESTNWQVGLALRWSLFAGGLRYFELQARDAMVRTAEAAVQRDRRAITQQLAQTRLQIDTAQASLRATRRREELARETARLVEAQYQQGAATQLDLLEATRTFADAQSAAALAELALEKYQIALEEALYIPTTAGASNGAQTIP